MADTGKGISRGSLERIFRPFEQEDNSMIRGQRAPNFVVLLFGWDFYLWVQFSEHFSFFGHSGSLFGPLADGIGFSSKSYAERSYRGLIFPSSRENPGQKIRAMLPLAHPFRHCATDMIHGRVLPHGNSICTQWKAHVICVM